MNWSIGAEGAALGVAAAGLAAAAALWHLKRSGASRTLLCLRLAAAACLALAALKPTVAARRPVHAKPRLLILVDHGHSMRGKAAGGTRLEAAKAWLKAQRPLLEERADPVLYAVAERGRRLQGFDELSGLKTTNAAFQASEALRDAADDARQSDRRPERAWLFTDGNAERSGELEPALSALGVPVDVVGVGPERRGKDLAFVDLKAPDFAFLHGRFWIEARLAASALAGQTVSLRLLREERSDGAAAWTTVAEAKLPVRGDYEHLSSSLSVVAQSLGPERYRLEARAGDAVRARDLKVEVIRQKYRIMYLAGRPSFEYAGLREFLKSDPSHDLVSFVILRNPDNPTLVADQELSLIPFPAEEIFVQSLPQFDLFILENFSYGRFRLPVSYLESLRAFVARGGALLVMGGENAFALGGYRGTPLEDVLPVALSPQQPDFLPGLFQPQVGSAAHPLARVYDTPEESKAAWDALPPLDGYAQFASVRPGTAVVAVHPQARAASGQPLPIIAAREYGRGKVMLVSSDSTWRWRLGAAADLRVGSFYARFWSRAVQYLTGSLDLSKVKFAPVADRLPPREPALLSVRVFDERFGPAPGAQTDLRVVWTGPDGKGRQVPARESEPGVYLVELTGLAPGVHKVAASARLRGKPWGEDKVQFLWEAGGEDLPMDLAWLRRVADASGGAATELAAADARGLLERLPAVRAVSEVSRRYQPAASPFWLLATALLLLVEWALRRLRGLP